MDAIRSKIDAIDRQMAALYEQRMALVMNVAEYKYNNNKNIFDSEREAAVVEKNLKFLTDSEFENCYIEFLRFIMDQSKRFQSQWIETQKKNNESHGAE
ncbi:chorismate mutase [Eubacterium aggregans]|uniref:chorismate mutase n=1 Tax=Eubacterium aggregans TaxID=81409 RepID=UPI003F2E34A5